jgi:DNA-binding response OmpR family regulator
MRLLLAEDDVTTAESLMLGFSAEGFTVRWAKTADDALASLSAQAMDVVVLDWMLPGKSGVQVLQVLRARGQRVPVLLLTARDAVADRVAGLEAGADDYLTKPFAFAELLARVRALLRRAQPAEPLRHNVGDLVVNFETRRAQRAGLPLELTPREFDLLAYLIRRSGEIVSRDQLAREVWNENQRATPIDNVIDVHVARLRRKLDDDQPHKLLHTVRGLGLMLRHEPPL